MIRKNKNKKGGRTLVIVSIVVIFQLLGLLSAVHSIMSVRTPQGSIAWAVSLIAIPYVSVPAYWVFGRNKFNGYILARQDELEQLRDVVRQASNSVTNASAPDDWRSGVVLGAETMARIPMTAGNRVELLVDGEQTFASLFGGIDAAKDYILIQFYIVRADDLGLRLQSKLIEAANRGVRVLFLYDEVGSIGLPSSYNHELTSAGVEIHPFHSRKGSGNRFQLNFRNHRKTVVVDGHSAWVGGHNVGDEYLGKDPKIGHWRDTHMRIDGPAIVGAQLAFVEDWRWATDELLTGLNWEPDQPLDGTAQSLVIASGPADALETASLMYTQAINAAVQRIWIASPYFVPDDAVVQALQLAALRGVDVRILIPEKADSRLVKLAAYSYFSEIKEAGVQFYRYQKGFLHEKVVLVDENVSIVGTANFDNRSFRLNFEISGIVVDQQFASAVETMFNEDFEDSRLMKKNEYEEKSFWFKLAVRVSRLTAPVL